MSSNKQSPAPTMARTHADAAAQLRRPFAPGAIGFRAMMRVPLNGDPLGGAHVAAYIGAQSVVQRLNAVVPGRWRQAFQLLAASQGAKKRYMACRLIITLPVRPGGRDVEAVYEDVGEVEAGSPAGLKALYSDARKRAAVAAGIGAYLYTAIEPVTLAIGPGPRQVQVVRVSGRPDALVISAATEEWLRDGYELQMGTDVVRRDLGEILAHGEPKRGVGQGESVEEVSEPSAAERFWNGETPDGPGDRSGDGSTEAPEPAVTGHPSSGNGVVVVDFGGPGPEAA